MSCQVVNAPALKWPFLLPFVLTDLCPQAHVREKLDDTRHSDVEQYLRNLYDLYTRSLFNYRSISKAISVLMFSVSKHSRTTLLATKLGEFNLGSDKHTFLSKLIKSIFSSYLESYIDMEKDYLRTRGAMILQRYYDSKNHQKRPIGTGRSVYVLILDSLILQSHTHVKGCSRAVSKN